ncbi:DUF1697 domain-containing protein [Chromobacterium paludis]|uniref:DUF1697 domain-containing protein n=1 Tax=Chromobacterium paludis TaxID=2605945 RepID=A0A5C1DN24_9NEIS|nr:DUF1697 domain-containing protein [Chromobacterium paludis]QEL57288.1 DUF1697 domain-containing protein [Chromobacterium paludis]
MEACVALLRGVNVGKAKRIAMADLRRLAAELGAADIATLLNSGNLLCRHASAATLAAGLEAAIVRDCGFSARVLALSGAELDAVVANNPYAGQAGDPARLLVAFPLEPAALADCARLDCGRGGVEQLHVGDGAAYLWCPDGLRDSPLAAVFSKRLGERFTLRNWATTLKLQQVLPR